MHVSWFRPMLAASAFLVVSCGREETHFVPSTSPKLFEVPAINLAEAVTGQTIYVPVYSHVAVGDHSQTYNLAVTLTIRNTDRAIPVIVTAIHYYDEHGELVRNFQDRPGRLGPLATLGVFVNESDVSGGSAASFVVEWVAMKPVSNPIVEAVMVGTRNQQGVSFTSMGKVVEEKRPQAPEDGAPGP